MLSTLAGHRYVLREEWGARAPTSPFFPIPVLPTPRLWIHHSGAEQHGPSGVREIQRYHQVTKGWKDIAYNFLVDDDGTLYEGRGPGIAGGATAGDNTRSHAICLLGNFEERPPAPPARQAVLDLARHGRDEGWWHPTCGGHRDAPGASTACPGRHVYAWLPTLQLLVATPPTTPEVPEMLMVQSEESGAVLLLNGGVTFLVENTDELAKHQAAGIPLARVAHTQFKRYLARRVA